MAKIARALISVSAKASRMLAAGPRT